MTALLVFPVCAILWMAINAKLGLVTDQPPMCDEVSPVTLRAAAPICPQQTPRQTRPAGVPKLASLA